MRLSALGRLFRRSRAQEAPPVPPPDPVSSREQRLAERFLEDEALRGDLDDDTWQPLQDWLLAVVARLAERTHGLDDQQAEQQMESDQSSLRRIAAALVDALAAGQGEAGFAARLEALYQELGPPIFEPARLPAARDALRAAAARLSAERPDGASAAALLVSALDTASATDSPEAS